jgi:PPK2 family polyphosphate:nucleotide phosphotransferase
MISKTTIEKLRLKPGVQANLSLVGPDWTNIPELKALETAEIQEKAQQFLEKNRLELSEAQSRLYANDVYGILVVLQGMSGADTSGTIKHVMSGVNPQGCQVLSFRKPSVTDLDHNFLWRYSRTTPERGRIGIFQHAYYEETATIKVFPETLEKQRVPDAKGKSFWEGRYRDINQFERHLAENGILVIKLFLNISKEEQRRRFLAMLAAEEESWKFSKTAITEREHWDSLLTAYEEILSATSTRWAPWYLIPADQREVAWAMVADILTTKIIDLGVNYPSLSAESRLELQEGRKLLMAEESPIRSEKS